MKQFFWTVITFILIGSSRISTKTNEIIVCGDDQVIIIDKKRSENEDVKILWKWKVSEVTDLPPAFQKVMIPTDDCKPVDGNRKILITSSGGGVVLVDRETKKTLFYAHVPMAHSAEYLPKDRIVVALSTAPDGNSIELFDVKKSDACIFKDSLYSGHGVVWMPNLKRLFALGNDVLREYSLMNWSSEKPELQLLRKWQLPENGGHDLTIISNSELLLTTTRGVWTFNIPNQRFSAFDLLNQVRNVKSVNYNSKTKELIYTVAEISWWTHHIYIKNPDKTLTLPDINLYKVRILSK